MPTSYAVKWDETGKRDIHSGVSRVVLYPMDGSSYGAGVGWSGVTAFNENPSGADITDLYADNIKYASLQAAEKYSFSIEAYQYPEAWAECDGSAIVKKNLASVGVILGQQTRKTFGLAVRTEIGDDTHPGMDKGYLIHLIYGCSASPSSRSYSTINENPDAITFSWDCNATPVEVGDGYKPVCTITIDSTKADATKLAEFETTLYGSASGNSEVAGALPTPAQVISTFTTT